MQQRRTALATHLSEADEAPASRHRSTAVGGGVTRRGGANMRTAVLSGATKAE